MTARFGMSLFCATLIMQSPCLLQFTNMALRKTFVAERGGGTCPPPHPSREGPPPLLTSTMDCSAGDGGCASNYTLTSGNGFDHFQK